MVFHARPPLSPPFRRWSVAVLAAALLLPPSAVTHAQSGVNLPSLGDGAGMSIAAERRLGDSIARDIYRDPDYLDDPVLVDYLQTLWQPLLGAARARGDVPPELSDRLAWQLLISRDKRVNAFALPGGYLGVHLGLVAATESSAELASVLAGLEQIPAAAAEAARAENALRRLGAMRDADRAAALALSR